MTKDEALKMAIETLENIDGKRFQHFIDETIQSCKEALEQPAQKPVAWMDEEGIWEYEWESYSENKKPLYTHPAPSWQGLNDDEIDDVKTKAIMGANGMSVEQLLGLIVSLTEQALKEKNT